MTKLKINRNILEQREQSQTCLNYAEPTNETRAETMLVLALPCKEEEEELNRDKIKRS